MVKAPRRLLVKLLAEWPHSHIGKLRVRPVSSRAVAPSPAVGVDHSCLPQSARRASYEVTGVAAAVREASEHLPEKRPQPSRDPEVASDAPDGEEHKGQTHHPHHGGFKTGRPAWHRGSRRRKSKCTAAAAAADRCNCLRGGDVALSASAAGGCGRR